MCVVKFGEFWGFQDFDFAPKKLVLFFGLYLYQKQKITTTAIKQAANLFSVIAFNMSGKYFRFSMSEDILTF